MSVIDAELRSIREKMLYHYGEIPASAFDRAWKEFEAKYRAGAAKRAEKAKENSAYQKS